MVLMDNCLYDLYCKCAITYDTAISRAHHPDSIIRENPKPFEVLQIRGGSNSEPGCRTEEKIAERFPARLNSKVESRAAPLQSSFGPAIFISEFG